MSALDFGARALALQARIAAGAGVRSPDGRPILLGFGCSILQGNTALANGNTSMSAAVAPGMTTMPLGSSSGFSVGSRVAFALHSGETFTSIVTGVPNGTSITIADRVPKLIRAGAYVQVYTTPRPDTIRNGHGIASGANAMLGAPFSMSQGYGYGGGFGRDMIADLPLWLRRLRPAVVVLHLFENDIPAGASLAELQRVARSAARMCVAAGSTPILCSSVPSTYIAGADQVAVFDGIREYVVNALPALVPGARGCDVSTPFLGTTSATTRPPIAGWSDSVHPNNERRYSYAAALVPVLASLGQKAPTSALLADQALHVGADCSGTGGSANGPGSYSGAVAAGLTIAVGNGIAATLSKMSSDAQRVQMSVAGASSVGDMVTVQRVVPLAANQQGGQVLRTCVRMKINAASNISLFQCGIEFSTGESYSCAQDAFSGTDPALIGQTLVYETPAVPVPEGASSATISMLLRPVTLPSPSRVSADVEFSVFGLLPGDHPVRGGIVLP